MTTAYVTTIKERCRMCYTCVRECPAKAIRIADGQAEIVPARCIACGNCVRVCAKSAKQIVSSVAEVRALLSSGRRVLACLAPSFPAELSETLDYRQLVGGLLELGFAAVHEVAFGADLVAAEYRRLLATCNGRRYISSACPAIVGFVERYHPELVDRLAPIVSPMVALARYLRQREPEGTSLVFLGPCVAKKAEAANPAVAGEIDAVLTFSEMWQMLEEAGIKCRTAQPAEFAPPHGGIGCIYPVSRGALQAANLHEDLLIGEIVSTQGRQLVREALQEFADGTLGVKLLELLCCEGCIMGAGMTDSAPLFARRRRVRLFAAERMQQLDAPRWEAELQDACQLPLERSFVACDQRLDRPGEQQLQEILRGLGIASLGEELNCGACGYETCREHAVAIHRGLAEHNMCLPHTIDRLSMVVRELEQTNQQLASAQEALMQSAKLASMGQLAAGIAHEVNNPLGVVLMYAHLLLDDCRQEDQRYADIQMIAEQADRCKKIVAGLLHFARQNKVARYATHLPQMVQRVVAAIPMPRGLRLRVTNTMSDPLCEIDKDQIAQVLSNLVNNAIAASTPPGEITITSSGDEQWVEVAVTDTGCGIPAENLKKIFEPFFTTKGPGHGTGLGLAVSYGIVKMHCGDIRVQSNPDPGAGPTGSTFCVRLPRREPMEHPKELLA